jgi:DNA-binding protein HU-beta
LNNKEFTTELSRRLGYTVKDTSELISFLLSEMAQELSEGNAVSAQGFGSFEVRKKAERISINPVSKLKMLVPPRLVLTFKPSAILKNKLK